MIRTSAGEEEHRRQDFSADDDDLTMTATSTSEQSKIMTKEKAEEGQTKYLKKQVKMVMFCSMSDNI